MEIHVPSTSMFDDTIAKYVSDKEEIRSQDRKKSNDTKPTRTEF